MKVSVIVPVYNVEKYLRKCLDSLVNQSFHDFEVIIINDGSLDNSQKIIDEYVKKYDFIKGYKKKNGGLSSARNYGLKYAKGDYVLFVDSDDYIEDDMLKLLYDSTKKNKSDIVVSEFNYVYLDGKKVRSYSNLDYTSDNAKKYLLTPPMAPIRLMKRELFDKIKFKENLFYEDLELCPKLLLYTKKISYVNEGLYNYLMRGSSIMHQDKFNDKLLDIYKVLDSNYDVLYNDYKDEIEYMYITHLLRTASLRFLDYKEGKKELIKIVNIFKERFPSWKTNKYFKMSGKKIKIICYLAYYKKIWCLKLIKKLTGK